MRSISTRARGFTIPELLIVMMVAGIVMALVFGPMDDIYKSQTTEMRTLVQQTDSKAALSTIAKDTSLAVKFNTENITDPVGPVPPDTSKKWNTPNYNYLGTGENNRILIVSKYATTTSDTADPVDNPQRKLLLIDDCRTLVQNTFIFYVKDHALWRRSIPGEATSSCAWQSLANGTRQSCPIGYSNTVCAGRDAKIADGVDAFKVEYYDSAAADAVPISPPGDISNASYVRVTLTVASGTGSNRTTATDSVVISRVNGEE